MSKPVRSKTWDERHLRYAVDAAEIALMSWNVDTNVIEMDDRGYKLWGMPLIDGVTFEDLSINIHPQDRDRVRAAFAATRAVLGNYDIDFRIMLGNDVRWISARGRGDDAGIIERVMYGVFLDVSARKLAEEAHELLSGEMSHRVKNLLAIATSLTQITSRSAKTTKDMAAELTQRLTSLGRAHDLVRPAPGRDTKSALLGDLLAILLEPYEDNGAFKPRIRVSVPRMAVGEASATTLALVIHELATNSLKYGSLSSDVGTLDVSCISHEGDVVVTWTERGGPPVKAPVESNGFGSKLVRRSFSSQLRGEIEYDWAAEGLVVTMRTNISCLSE